MIIDPCGRIVKKQSKAINDDMVIADIDLIIRKLNRRRWLTIGRRPELLFDINDKIRK